MADLHKKMTLFRDRYEIQTPYGVYQIEGDFQDWDYTSSLTGYPVASVSKEFQFLTPDAYVVDVPDEKADLPLILGFTIIIDEVKDDQPS